MFGKKIFYYLILAIITFTISCKTTDVSRKDVSWSVNKDDKSDKYPESVWNMTSEEGYLYFTGISSYYLDEKKSDEILLKDASQSAAVFNSVFGVSGRISARTDFGTRTGNSFNYVYNNSDFEYHRENLEIESTYKDSESVYRIFKIKKNQSMPAVELSTEDKTPSWITKVPEIDGFLFSIGVSGRYSRISDSVRNADDAALEEMIKQKNITVFTDSGYNYSNNSGYEYASSELQGFYIIRRWWSPDLKNFYSLGIIMDK